MTWSQRLRLGAWVLITIGLAGGLAGVEISLWGRSVLWPAPAGRGPVSEAEAVSSRLLAPVEVAWLGRANTLSLAVPRPRGDGVMRVEIWDQGRSAAPDIRFSVGDFVAPPPRRRGRRPPVGYEPGGWRLGDFRVVFPAEVAAKRTSGTAPVRVLITNLDPGWLIVRRIEVYPLWWQGSGLLLRLTIGIYIGLSVLLLWPLGRPGGLVALHAASWLAAAGAAVSICLWGRRLIMLNLSWGPESLIVCLLVWGVGQALSVGQLGTFWGAGPAWVVGKMLKPLRRPRPSSRQS
ncbi:MAG: hypothetical protein KJ621_04905 [Proteobacteria bacterium]|nr:hypothetical protein [Pseudomonadota bacterium]MBU1741694.1 hypothetical protein [Pseudomonadota bacterium]